MNRIHEIEQRLSAIATEIETASGDALVALETEVNQLTEERSALLAEVESRKALRSKVALGAGSAVSAVPAQEDEELRSAKAFAESKRMSVASEQTRSILVSGGTLARPTEVHGINDIEGAKVSSILDMVTVANCEGMGANRVAYVVTDADTAADQTEGSAATAKEPVFGYVDITPDSVAVQAQISKQAKKQSPLNYKGKVQEQAFTSLRKAAASKITAKLKASTLVGTVNATVASSKGVVNEKTLRNLVLQLGGDEGINTGVLFLNKTDLIALGDVRGTNEKKAVFEIIPDGSNPNVGLIKDGGLTVRYCINSGLTACAGTSQSSTAAIKTMFYGDPTKIELDLFSQYEIRVSEDFAFTSLMDTILGDVELGADVVAKGAFVALTIPKA